MRSTFGIHSSAGCQIALAAGVLLAFAGNHSLIERSAGVGVVQPRTAIASPAKHARAAHAAMPLAFEARAQQTDGTVTFLARGADYAVFVTPRETLLALRNSRASTNGQAVDAGATVIRMQIVGGAPSAHGEAVDRLPGRNTSFVGSNADAWRHSAPTYRRVKFSQVYAGVDVVYYGTQRELEHDFIVAPGGSPESIRVKYDDATLAIASDGGLVIRKGAMEVRQNKPFVYQDVNGTRREVPARYALIDGATVGFAVDAYDARHALVIDPVLVYSTYLGGTRTTDSAEGGGSIAINAAGEAYIAGSTFSEDFPTAHALQPGLAGASDIFVTKLTADGSAFAFSTYLGGNGNDNGQLALDAAGAVYVAGQTESTDFPTTPGAYRRSGPGAYALKLDGGGTALIYSTFLYAGGVQAMAVDAEGHAYLAASMRSPALPVRNAFQPDIRGDIDATLLKLNADGSDIEYATYLGGTGHDVSLSVTVDAAGAAVISGLTLSTDFPTLNPIQPHFAGGVGWGDCWIAKLSPTGATLVFSTYLGGSGEEFACRVALGPGGNVHVVGHTISPDFPTQAAVQSQLRGPSDAFVAKLALAGNALEYSTYLGGTHNDQGHAIAVDPAGNAYVTGLTTSTDFPTVNPIQPGLRDAPIPVGAGDVFLTKFNARGSALIYSTYLGGDSQDYGLALAVDRAGSAYVTGYTGSSDFPTARPIQPDLAGSQDAFVFKVADLSCPENITGDTDIFQSAMYAVLPALRLQFVLLRNRSTTARPGLLSFVTDDIRNGFVLTPFATSCVSASGSQFVLFDAGADGVFSPGEYVLGALLLYQPGDVAVTYTPHVLAGVPSR